MTLFGCSTLLSNGSERGAGSQPRRATETVQHVVLIALDGVRPFEIFSGVDPTRAHDPDIAIDDGPAELMPRLWALAARGVALGAPGGAAFSVTGPNFVSLPGYTEILSGVPATCQENDCPGPPPAPTLIDAVCDTARAGERCDAALFSSWREIERVSAVRRGRALVSAGRAGGEGHEPLRRDPALGPLYERGLHADPAPGHGTYRPDRETAALAIGYLQTHRPRFTFIGLGDTDELAHAGDYRGYLKALGEADRVIGAIDDLASRWAALGESTIVVVTTDHGRGASFRDHGREHPESQRSWLVAAGPGIPTAGAVALARPRFARDLAPTLALALGVTLEPARDDWSILSEMLEGRGRHVERADSPRLRRSAPEPIATEPAIHQRRTACRRGSKPASTLHLAEPRFDFREEQVMSNRFGDRFRDAYRDTRRWWDRDDRYREDAREQGLGAWGDDDRYGHREPRGYGADRPRGYEYDEGRFGEDRFGERRFGEHRIGEQRVGEHGFGGQHDERRFGYDTDRDRDRDREHDAEIDRERRRVQQMRSRQEWERSHQGERSGWREDFDRDRWREGLQAQAGYGGMGYGGGMMVGPDPAGRYWYRGQGQGLVDERYGGGIRDVGRFEGRQTLGQRIEEHRRIATGPKGYKRSDERIRDDLCDTLSQAVDLDSSDVEVKVQNGEVILTGTVPERHMKLRIEQFADHIPGVTDVNNQIRVKRIQHPQQLQQQTQPVTRQYGEEMEGNGRKPAGTTRI